MKKFRNSVVAASLCCVMLFSSCIGSFPLFHKVLAWNEGVDSRKFVNELVFFALTIVPVYELAFLFDAVVMNSVEFWTGSVSVQENSRTLKGENGDYLVERTQDGYTITKGEESVKLMFDGETNTWSYMDGENRVEVIRFNDNLTATLPNGRTVPVNAAGMMAARQSADYGYLNR